MIDGFQKAGSQSLVDLENRALNPKHFVCQYDLTGGRRWFVWFVWFVIQN